MTGAGRSGARRAWWEVAEASTKCGLHDKGYRWDARSIGIPASLIFATITNVESMQRGVDVEVPAFVEHGPASGPTQR